jgi:predicted deacylase
VVIYHLINALKDIQIQGEIVLVPNCNPVGTNIKAGEYTLGRFDPVNGTNWNRGYFYDKEKVQSFADTVSAEDDEATIKALFRKQWQQEIENKLEQPWGLGLAQQLNLRLQQLAFDADYVLDLHNGPVSTRHVSLYQMFLLAPLMKLAFVLGGPYKNTYKIGLIRLMISVFKHLLWRWVAKRLSILTKVRKMQPAF